MHAFFFAVYSIFKKIFLKGDGLVIFKTIYFCCIIEYVCIGLWDSFVLLIKFIFTY